MPEAGGTFVLKIDKETEAILREENEFTLTAITKILSSANIDSTDLIGKSKTRQMGHHLLDLDLRESLFSERSIVIKKGYVGVDIFGSDWMGFAHLLVKEGQRVESYANMSDEYGTRLKIGRNNEGKIYGLTFDEENPDEGEFQSFGNGAWKDFIPLQVQKFFKDIV